MRLPFAIIFLSGAATLALELLASRVMTPYFGVSLYIWTGILSITLVALAAGYWWGGRLAARLAASRQGDSLATAFLLMPAIGALSLVLACLAYPHVFPLLAARDLVLGAFGACLLLLALPLVVTSAMNPLLIAMHMRSNAAAGRRADAGAGRVFFTSTVGSVAGVLVTAFYLVPTFSNFVSLLIVAVALALLPLAGLRLRSAAPARRKPLAIVAAIALVASTAMLWQADAYLGRMWPVRYSGLDWTVEAAVGSMFGTVKVLKSTPVDASGRFVRVYFHDGLIQNRSYSDGQPFTFYTYALEALALSYRPAMRSALVLGLGAGVVPSRLAERGVDVTAVEIDPASFVVAQRYFGLRIERIRAVQADARTYLRRCAGTHDAVIVDLFHGDGTPDYLVTRDFFADLRRCLAPQGVVVLNTFADLRFTTGYAHFLATLRSEFPFVRIYRQDEPGARHLNSFVVASVAPLSAANASIANIPPRYAEELDSMLRRPRQLDPELLAGGRVITDARSASVRDIARTQMSYRAQVARDLPPAFLLN